VPQIILGPGLDKLDGSLQKLTYSFLTKLAKDDTASGLHIEPINNSVDPRARTGRVNQSFRAVLFKLQGSQHEASYVFAGTYPHDNAIAIAQNSKIDINPRNGVAELIPTDDATPNAATPSVAPPASSSDTGEHQSLRAREYTVEDLTNLGFDADFAASALDLVGDDAVLDYALTTPVSWQRNALLDLYTGASFNDITTQYQLDEPESVDAGDDDRVLTAMQHPAARMQFAFIEDDDELRAALENPDFAAWRLFLHPRQRAYTTRDYPGALRLTGGAGTGKTVVLLHRTRNLHRKNPSAAIVLTTFNRTLADTLVDQLKLLDTSVHLASDLGQPGIYVAGIDAIAHRILATSATELSGSSDHEGAVSQVLGPRTAHVLKPTPAHAWSNAADEHIGELPDTLRSTAFLEAEYATVVLPNHITSREQYLKVRRTGRGVALNRSRRNAVWSVIETYRAGAAADGSTDFDEKAALAAAVLADSHRPAENVLVDEGQDLSPCRLQLVRALAADGPNDFFLTEDSHQRIYGQHVVLSRYGINIRGRRSQRLTLNYRTTQQNLRYALGILGGEHYTDLDDEDETTAGYRSARRGPRPLVIAAESLTDQYDKVVDLVRGWIDAGTAPETIGLLVPTRKEAESLPRALGDRDLTVGFVDRDQAGPPATPVVMTMHRAKGMEFAKAILVGVSERALPRGYLIDTLPEEDRADAKRRERSLLYVAATRARDQLAVIYVGQPSELLPEAVFSA
jgi:superfamily I DNA/RNA helicase